MMADIAVLITCHNRKHKTISCLTALFACMLPPDYSIQVFLVDDGSTDGTGDLVKTTFPQVKVIQAQGDLYWNRGMHAAWNAAKSHKNFDYYLWLNDDTYLFRNAVEVLLTTAIACENKSIIVGASCSSITGNPTYSGFYECGQLIVPSEEPIPAHTFHGNCVLISNYVFQKVGNLDRLFHHAIGDMDYGLRASKLGIQSLIAPGYIANCENNDRPIEWCLSSTPLYKRINSLYSPLGNSQPYYYFRFELRHFGLLVALKHLFSIHLRLLVPSLWKQ